jgi:hypothetical protein
MAFNLANLTAQVRKVVEQVQTEENRQKLAGALAQAKQVAVSVAGQIKDKTDTAAQATAVKITQWTGRETTPAEVKKAAIVAGAAVAAVGAVACLGACASQGTAGSGRQWGSDFESQTLGFMAESGGSFDAINGHISY